MASAMKRSPTPSPRSFNVLKTLHSSIGCSAEGDRCFPGNPATKSGPENQCKDQSAKLRRQQKRRDRLAAPLLREFLPSIFRIAFWVGQSGHFSVFFICCGVKELGGNRAALPY